MTLPLAAAPVVERLFPAGGAAGSRVEVTVTDRGPHTKGYIVDVSRRAAVQLDIIEAGVVPVVVTVIRAAPAR